MGACMRHNTYAHSMFLHSKSLPIPPARPPPHRCLCPASLPCRCLQLNTAYSAHEIVGDYMTAVLKWFEGRGTANLTRLAEVCACVQWVGREVLSCCWRLPVSHTEITARVHGTDCPRRHLATHLPARLPSNLSRSMSSAGQRS